MVILIIFYTAYIEKKIILYKETIFHNLNIEKLSFTVYFIDRRMNVFKTIVLGIWIVTKRVKKK